MFAKNLKPCAAQVAKAWKSSHHTYATVSNSDSGLPHRSIWPTTPYPTPYQILEMDPMTQKYSKSRFAELVKLYHPDRAASVDPRCANLPQAVRLERYHMVIAAHDILSNSEKRLAYDRYGAGWTRFNRPMPSPIRYTAGAGQYQSYSGHARGFDPYSARMNATWEDWEHWRASRSDKSDSTGSESRGEPVFMPHGVFAAVLFMASVTAGLAQHKSAQSIAHQRGMFRDEMHTNAQREYELRKKAKSSISRDERIESFARSRDPSKTDEQE